ncbi:NAD(P)/FAD-dependent oxidoreductase [Agromyces sp. ISL-38]|uniref:NAD(P)/FAD-dependent oxidoreductase n=1 Tax=Agromyces sp. ISL-38 TaxID=2819107 RepID=UPI001BEBE5B8|nr:NAD(P)/FAD-dependent oxidoreductase [Agromyces sp. ISL-38]MBT2499172.1 NAD(P)/FAD-dependent oxidoreductase [Agromyces sp. ISL-38]
MHNNSWDVIIIGGGSAGLSAALMLGRARRRVLVVDGGAPRNRFAPHMHGVLGRDGWSPLDLLAVGREEVERYGVVIESTDVTTTSLTADGFEVVLPTGELHHGRRMLVATGQRDELPDIPGLAEQWGTGAVVCPYCDGWEVRDRRIAVLGTAPMSVHQAQLLRQWSADVTYFVNGVELPADAYAGLVARGIAIETREVTRIIADEDGRLRGIRLADCTDVAVDSIFLHPLPVPNDVVLRQLGAATTEELGIDWVAVDAEGRTSVPGLWAAGNVTSARTSVPIASAAGNLAGATINADLIDEEIREAVAASVASGVQSLS